MNDRNLPQAHHVIEYAGEHEQKTVRICRCWKSLKFPYCDDSHKQLLEHGENVGPFIARLEPHYPNSQSLPLSDRSFVARTIPSSKVLTRQSFGVAVGIFVVAFASYFEYRRPKQVIQSQALLSSLSL